MVHQPCGAPAPRRGFPNQLRSYIHLGRIWRLGLNLHFPFDEQQRVKYRTNPLVEVVCQFRFPKLLRLESDLPADFQDEIKSEFPKLKEQSGYEIEMQISEGRAAAPDVKQTPVKTYDFLSNNENWKVGLGSSSISLSCRKYEDWKEFRDYLIRVYDIFVRIYQPAYINRCGLRYINVIDPLLFGLEQSDLSELISADLIGEHHKKLLGNDDIREFSGSYSVALSSTGHFLRVNYGLVKHPQEKRQGFKIDGDFWIEGNLESKSDVITQSLDQFNRGAGSLFRCSIDDKLFQALGPE